MNHTRVILVVDHYVRATFLPALRPGLAGFLLPPARRLARWTRRIGGVVMAIATTIRADDEPLTRAEIVEALCLHNHEAKRAQTIVGLPGPSSLWDRRHYRINQLLDDLESVQV